MYPNTQLYINGQWKDALDHTTLDVINPADETTIGSVAKASVADLDLALEAAAQGFDVWKNTPASKRSKIMQKAAQNLRERADAIAKIMTLEQGKPLAQAKAETLGAADTIDWFAGEALRAYGHIVPPRAIDVQSLVVKSPVGVVAAFTPWNFPLNQVVRKLSAALAAGCSIIIKGPEDTPASPAQLIHAFHDAGVPKGVINLVYGVPSEISEYLIPHPIVKKISFTGSTPVGKQLASLAGLHMKKVTMELGGHAPVLIFKDADLDTAAKEIVAAKFRNAGQVCIAPTRFIIAREVYEQFTQKLVDQIQQLKVANGLEEGTDIGPMIHARGFKNIQRLIEDAITKGAKLCFGGKALDGKGFFMQPTILKDVPLEADCMSNEPFGPLILCIPFDHYEEAIQEANRLPYGLAAYAYSESNKTCMALGRDIQAGMLTINYIGLSVPELPFGGVNDSGYGSEGGSEAIEAYLNTRLVTIAGR
ncbi:MAG: NAD-dependent succinate-semialdehyde dehydrogenase [Acinetobacter populi]|jgi:succinate-semialdehyde dehydrogenase/glutarate-semialdehyde dehydrogenase|uniref:NAD-dependent succinate-semialdehyde dehydrogenase n=1 Tax=Acinetobacter populi TaxID=1582270 RepID=UPI0023570629|nr:NAD-dependent succinate-semialdehyde dehydrogenase [Acinetobacter populi]MCH4248178.1 NAD-dependent succinate-semialdehyde dehydrogenase [Acinetobacter populi]